MKIIETDMDFMEVEVGVLASRCVRALLEHDDGFAKVFERILGYYWGDMAVISGIEGAEYSSEYGGISVYPVRTESEQYIQVYMTREVSDAMRRRGSDKKED